MNGADIATLGALHLHCNHERQQIWNRVDDERKFIRAYIEAALWSTHDAREDPPSEYLDATYNLNDLSDELLLKVLEECRRFIRENIAFINPDMEQAGHDFWLTRNRHGAGFWDGDWEEPEASILTDNSHRFGEQDWYVGDDGKIYA